MAASTQTIQKMYIAYFGRPADTIGLQYWADKTEAQIIAGFSASSESQALFGNQGSAAKVNAIYNNLFARDAEPAGLQYWVQKLNSGEVSQAEAMYTILNNAGAGDATAVANKLAAAEAFTAQIDTTPEILGYTGANAAQSAREWLGKVNANAASLDAAKASAPAALAAAAGASAGDSGKTFTLTTGADTIVGTSGNDTINALTINAAGTAADTLTAFDSIDGGAGNDTLNIYTDSTAAVGAGNKAFPSNVTVKNVETINYNNANAGVAIDASKFVGATAINQIGGAAAVTNLAAGTTAGFNGTAVGPLSVTAADAAATAAVALTNVAEGLTVNVIGSATGVLNSVTVTGTVADTDKSGTVANTTVAVTAGKDVESVSVNSAVATTLTVADGAGTKKVSTVDASASTGAVTYSAAATVANVKTGAGNDTATLNTSLNATVKAASVSTGAGNDTVNVTAVVGTAATGQTVAADAGEGNDIINLTIEAGVTYNVAAGAGDDTVAITGTVKTTDKIDGGVGADVVSLTNNAALVADDYIVFNKVLTNFETLKLNTATTAFDASQLAATYNTIDLAGSSVVTKVGTQALIANGALTATANGFVADDAGTPANELNYAGTLSITAKAAGTVTANAQNVALTVAPVTNKDGLVDNTAVTLTGAAKSATVTLSAVTDTKGTPATTDDVLDTSSVSVTTVNGGALVDLASLTLTGNGAATVVNAVSTKLVTVDASGLNSVNVQGVATAGLTYTSSNALAETIKLGAGLDTITLNSSKYGAVDTVQGLNLVQNAAGTALDAAKSDKLVVTSTAATTFVKFATTQTDMDLALKDAAAYQVGGLDADNLVFQVGGNTYVYQDNGSDANLLDAGDTLVQLTGLVNLDALIQSVNVA